MERNKQSRIEYGFQHTLLQIGENIHQMRLKRGWSLEDLSTETGLDVDVLQAVEVGKDAPELITLYRLACGFGLFFEDAFICFLEGEN